MAAALYGQGCPVTNDLGEPFKVLVAGEWIAPFLLMADLHSGAVSGDHWKDLCSRAGLSELDLGVTRRRMELKYAPAFAHAPDLWLHPKKKCFDGAREGVIGVQYQYLDSTCFTPVFSTRKTEVAHPS